MKVEIMKARYEYDFISDNSFVQYILQLQRVRIEYFCPHRKFEYNNILPYIKDIDIHIPIDYAKDEKKNLCCDLEESCKNS